MDRRDPWEELEDRFFVAGQMDAQGTAAEKWKIGSGGPVLAMSKRMLGEARALVAKMKAELEARERIIEVYEGQLAKRETVPHVDREAFNRAHGLRPEPSPTV